MSSFGGRVAQAGARIQVFAKRSKLPLSGDGRQERNNVREQHHRKPDHETSPLAHGLLPAILLLIAVTGAACRTAGGANAVVDSEQVFHARSGESWKSDEQWRAIVMPTDDELAFMRIPWLPSLHQGVERAIDERKPLLLWMMNGHPLGCT